MIKGGVLLAAGHKSEASQIGEHGSRPILAVKPEQHTLLQELVGFEIARDDSEPLAQFLSIAPVAKTAEPLETVSLTDDGSCPHDLPPLASGVTRGTDFIQSAKGWGQVVSLRQRALPGCSTCTIDIKDDPGVPCSIHQSSRLLVLSEEASEQIVEKERAQHFDGFLR
jgi:hypothetical protein